MAKPFLKLYKLASDGESADLSTELDITTFIADGGLQIEHEDLDAKNDNTDGGRDITTGTMGRTRIANKHTLTVKCRRVYTREAHSIFSIIFPAPRGFNKNPFFAAKYISPCIVIGTESGDGSATKIFYCSSVNYGAQRYDREKNAVFYDGMTFKMIEK